MKSINERHLRVSIRQELFNNNLNEMFQTDYVDNIAYNRDRPGPDISGDQEYQNSFDIEEDMPILPSDLMSDPTILRVNHDVVDDQYVPQNKKELRTATLSLVDIYEDLEDKKKIEKVWNNFRNLLSKVCDQWIVCY